MEENIVKKHRKRKVGVVSVRLVIDVCNEKMASE